MKFIFLSIILLIGPNSFGASNSSCEIFAGKYSKQMNNDDTYFAQGVEIKFEKTSSTLELKYNSDLPPQKWNGWIESYIADGNSHQGDSNTGTSYIVSCEGNEGTQIAIRRFGLLNKTLITTLTLQDDQLLFVQYAQGDEIHYTQMLLKKNQ